MTKPDRYDIKSTIRDGSLAIAGAVFHATSDAFGHLAHALESMASECTRHGGGPSVLTCGDCHDEIRERVSLRDSKT